MEDPLLPCDLDRMSVSIRDDDAGSRRFSWEDLLSPVLGTTVLLPFAVAFVGVITAANPNLAPHTPKLLSTVILSQAIGGFWFARFSQYCTCTNIDLLSAAYVAQLGVYLHRQALYMRNVSDGGAGGGDDALALLAQVLVGQAMFTIIVGLLLLLAARFNGVWYLRYLPYPVACGFVSGIGLIVLDGGFELGCNHTMKDLVGQYAQIPRETWLHTGATVLVGCFFLALKSVILNAMRLPVGLLAVTIVVHGGARFLGISEQTMTAHRMFLQGLQPESWVSGWQAVLDEFSSIDLGLFGSQGYLSLTVSYALLHLMVYPFYAIGMQDIDQPREKFDLRKEIKQLGGLNVCVGALLGVPSCHSYKVCIVMKAAGAKTRLWVVLLSLTFLALYFDTAIRPAIAVVPTCAFGGLVFSLGVDLITASLVESGQRVASEEWRAVMVTALMTYVDVLTGLIFGSLLTMGLFVVEYAGITGVVNQANFLEVRSLLKRPKEDRELLAKHGLQGVVFWCSGYIFFGTASGIVEEVEEYLDANPTTRYVVVDFEGVPAVDASGVHALTEFAARCGARKPRIRVCFCGLVRRLHLALKNVIDAKGIVDPPRLYSRRVEQALEWAEEEILRRARLVKPPFAHGMTLEAPLASPEGDPCTVDWLCKMVAQLAPAAAASEVEALATELLPSVQLLSYAATGSLSPSHCAAELNSRVIFVEGACAYDLFYIVAGGADLLRSLEGEAAQKLPRHHLNKQKGDLFVFEERTEVRVQQLREGSLLGVVEFGAALGEDSQCLKNRPRRTTTAVAAPACKALRVPFTDLHEAFARHPAVGHLALAALFKRAASQVIELMRSMSVKPYRVALPMREDYAAASPAAEESLDRVV